MGRKKTLVELPCTYCNTPTLFHPSRMKKAKKLFCSRECYAKDRGNNPAMHPCTTCGTQILRRIHDLNDPKPFFCSKLCVWAFYKRPIAERFWEKVDKSGGPDACWEWQVSRNQDGYGMFGKGLQKNVSAHIMAYELTFGPIPKGLQVLHRCDNRPCANPSHFFLGTQAENIQDCVAKGRHSHGETNSHAKLTDIDVREILRLKETMSQLALAKHFNVSKPTISHIWRGFTWRHIPRD